ncbi:hypothetical protein IAT38_006144 [Cryptococcus sp. DSM 104549]
MGLFGKPKAAYSPPELPTHTGHASSSSEQEPAPPRRGSIFPGLAAIGITEPAKDAPVDPVTRMRTISGQQQTTFLGRRMSQAIVPAWSRKASLAGAKEDVNPVHLRMGESDPRAERAIDSAFYDARLTIDEASDEEDGEEGEGGEDERRPQGLGRRYEPERSGSDLSSARSYIAPRRDKGKGKAMGWGGEKLGWEAAPPRGAAKMPKRKAAGGAGKKHRHRSKRIMRELDEELDAFNRYAQNGLVPLARSDMPSRDATSLSIAAMANRPGVLDSDDPYLPQTPQQIEALDELDDKIRVVPVGDGFDALDVMGDHIFRIGAQKKKWFKAPRMGAKRDKVATGVTIRAKTGLYRTFPVDYEALFPFEEAMAKLNPEVAIKIRSDVVNSIMVSYINPSPSMSELVIDANTRIQILDNIELLARARKHQYAAFVRSEQVLCVWADDVEMVIPAAEALEEALIQFIWKGEAQNAKYNQAMVIDAQLRAEDQRSERRASSMAERVGKDGEVVPTLDEKEEEFDEKDVEEGLDPEDLEFRKLKRYWRERPVMLISPMSDALAIIFIMCLMALGLRTLIKEYVLDGKATRFVLVIFIPALFCIAAYACMCVVGSVFQIIGPIRQVTQKSRYFSGVPPKRTMGELSHVTVQLPVYKESLEEVIMPTVESLKRAVTTYERQGGSVGILVCDDGLQLLSKAEADRRRQFYFDNSIAYVARPGHGVEGYVRKGRFKKAGNMNFATTLSLRVEEIMDEMRPEAQQAFGEDHMWNELDENNVYDRALAQVLEEREGKAWAAGNIRFGEIILIIDSDTRVPEDCFADAVNEMKESPEVAIIQHMSGVMQVANHFFENGVAHFTRGIQHAISYCCASGEVAPFVGHNAFLRWSALQECMSADPDDGILKIWSEDHVSEDFQIAVTLQIKGYTVRWATYSGGDFEEGVSLTCDDELNRWQKYAFGCSELLFYPLKRWIFKGPITPLFHEFIWSSIPIHSKFTICGYIFSYYAIACAWFLSVFNYFIMGFDIPVDGYYLPSWQVNLVCIILFVGLCNIAFITLRYRLKIPDCSKLAWDQIKWIPFFSIFFTGMSMPMSAALVSHLVGYNMTWSTTIKTVEKSNFFLQMPIIWRRFWPQLVFFSLCVVAMIITSSSLMPSGYRVNNIEVYVPMGILTASHLLYPFALNPWFLSFSF